MKTCMFLLLGLLAVACDGQDYVYETFDSYPLGPIEHCPGWGLTNFYNIFTNVVGAEVSTVQPHCGPNHLRFKPAPAGKQAILAIYTNFNAVYSPSSREHPVLRFSFMLYMSSPTQYVAFFMDNGLGEGVMVAYDPGIKRITVQDQDTYTSFVAGRYTEMAILYNMSNNHLCVQYDGTNIFPWSNPQGISITQINYLAFLRLPDGDTNAVYVDHVRVDRATPDTVFWYRFENGASVASDHTGFLNASRITGTGNMAMEGSPDPLYDGRAFRRNELARSAFLLNAPSPWTNSPNMPEWTLEAIVRVLPGATSPGLGNLQFLDWGSDLGFNSTNSRISLTWHKAGQLILYLRDAQQTNADEQYLFPMGELQPDGRYHHVAVVKTGASVKVFRDYMEMANASLTSVADGTYMFTPSSRACIGITLNGGNQANAYQWLDELRFTARGLKTSEFLQPGQPIVCSAPNPGTALWEMRVVTISGLTYQAQSASHVGATNWTTVGSAVTATGHYTRLLVPTTTARVFRAIRP